MLNGVGGRTIAEAKENLHYFEFRQWIAYRSKRGSLNQGMRIEEGAALVASILANANSRRGGYSMTDFMPHADDVPVTLEQAMEQWV